MVKASCLALFYIIGLFHKVKMEIPFCYNSMSIAALPKNTPIFTKLACADTSVTLECSEGKAIHIANAHYGRLTMGVCNPRKVKTGWKTDCSSPNTTDIVSNLCNDLPRCEIELRQLFFGDPCPKTTKYLDVKFQCKTGNVTYSVINPISTGTLLIKCSMNFMTSENWGSLNFIKLYHLRNKINHELVAQVENNTQLINIADGYKGAVARGVISNTSISYLSVEIANPGFDNEGSYKCVAEGKLKSGRRHMCPVEKRVLIDENYQERCLALIFIDTFPRDTNSTNSVIDPGTTEALLVKCSMDNLVASKWDSVSSLKLYQYRSKDKYDLVAFIDSVSRQVKVTSGQDGVGFGVISNTLDSYISVQWANPYFDKAGTYRCEVEGKLTSKSSQSCSAYGEAATTLIKNEKCSTSILIDALPHNANSKTKYLVPGYTKTLVVNCSIDVRRIPESDTLNSLVLARFNDKGHLDGPTVIAQIDTTFPTLTIPESNFSKNSMVNYTYSIKSESYLSVTWNNPGSEVSGTYLCISKVMQEPEKYISCLVNADIYAVQSCVSEFKISTLVKDGNQDGYKTGFQIKQDITKHFLVNCTLNATRTLELDSLDTITLIRIDLNGVTQIVGSINRNLLHVNIADGEKAVGKGLISNTSVSFLSVLWENPGLQIAGTYTCEASGTSMAEKPQKCSVSANISSIRNCATALIMSTAVYEDDQNLTSTAEHIKPGITKLLKVKCVLNVIKTVDLDKLITLTLLHSKVNSTEYNKITSIITTSGPFETYDAGEGVGYGFISNFFESHLSVLWDYPDSNMAGTYTCEASGMSNTGQLQQCSVSADISSTPNIITVPKKKERCNTSLYIDTIDLKAKCQTSIPDLINIEPGSTIKLRINCSMNVEMTTAIYKTKSLTLLRAKTTKSKYEEVASINPVDGVNVNDEDGVGGGVISSKGESYLYVEWSYPYDDMAGKYRCEAHGRTRLSKPETCSSTKIVSSSKMSFKSLHQLQRLGLLEMEQPFEKFHKPVQRPEQEMSTTKRLNDTAALEVKEKTKFEEEFKKTFFFLSKQYNGHRYFLSKTIETFIDEKHYETCKKYGGYLVELDDYEEAHFVRTILRNYTENAILISGTDKLDEGRFVYNRNGIRDVTFLDFRPGEPDGGKWQNCLYMTFENKKWLLQDNFCAYYCETEICNFLCEMEAE